MGQIGVSAQLPGPQGLMSYSPVFLFTRRSFIHALHLASPTQHALSRSINILTEPTCHLHCLAQPSLSPFVLLVSYLAWTSFHNSRHGWCAYCFWCVEDMTQLAESLIFMFMTGADIEDIAARREQFRCPHFHILVIGRANAGKTTILEKVCGVAKGTKPIIVYDQKSKFNTKTQSTWILRTC